MHCRECGESVRENTEICTNCGVRPLNSNKHCQGCGTRTKPEQELCVSCGVRLTNRKSSLAKDDNPSGILNLAVCCFPIIGLILYFVWKDEKPNSARAVCKWAIIGTVLGFVLYIIAMVMGALSELMYY
jgi:uncharacterized membrane protein YvbJ